MDLQAHAIGEVPQWEVDRAEGRELNAWQRLAEATHSIITPGNFVTALGVVAGVGANICIARDKPVAAITFAGIEGLADVGDGELADLTRTKCPFGKKLDGGSDQFRIASLFVTLAVKQVIPKRIAAILVGEKLAITVPSSIAILRGNEPTVASEGKISAGFQRTYGGLVLVDWLFRHAAERTNRHKRVMENLSKTAGLISYLPLSASVLTTPLASREYIAAARKPTNPAKMPRWAKRVITR